MQSIFELKRAVSDSLSPEFPDPPHAAGVYMLTRKIYVDAQIAEESVA